MPSTSIPQSEVRNMILAPLPAEEYGEMAPLLERIELASGKIIYAGDEPIRHVYFVEDAMLSLLSTLEDGTSVEVGALGREGMGGLSSLLGSDSATHTGLIQIGGAVLRMKVADARAAFDRHPHFHAKVLRYTRLLLSQISQTVACNTLHTVEERLARWLLICRQRMESDTLALTQEFLSHMLGVRRSGVTVACGILQRAGLIQHSRGQITITDPEGLREASCECVKAMSEEFDAFLNEDKYFPAIVVNRTDAPPTAA